MKRIAMSFVLAGVFSVFCPVSLVSQEAYLLDDYLEIAGKQAGLFFTLEIPNEDFIPTRMGTITNVYGMNNVDAVISNIVDSTHKYMIITNSANSNVLHLISSNIAREAGRGLDQQITISYNGSVTGLLHKFRELSLDAIIDSSMVRGRISKYEGNWDWSLNIHATNRTVREVLTNYLPKNDEWFRLLWKAERMQAGQETHIYGVRFGGKRIQQPADD